MSRLREKTTATLLIAIFMISTFAVAMPASAQDLEKPEVMVSAMGHFTTNLVVMGHRCFVNLHTRKVADGWMGQGVFWDRDYKDGKLVAIFTVQGISYEDLPYQVNHVGTADVYINDEYVGTKTCETILFMGRPGFKYEFFSFQIRGQGLDYYAFESGYRPDGQHEDISVKLTLKELD